VFAVFLLMLVWNVFLWTQYPFVGDFSDPWFDAFVLIAFLCLLLLMLWRINRHMEDYYALKKKREEESNSESMSSEQFSVSMFAFHFLEV